MHGHCGHSLLLNKELETGVLLVRGPDQTPALAATASFLHGLPQLLQVEGQHLKAARVTQTQQLLRLSPEEAVVILEKGTIWASLLWCNLMEILGEKDDKGLVE